MAGRLKDGVASARLCPAIHVFSAARSQERGCPAQGRAWRARCEMPKSI